MIPELIFINGCYIAIVILSIVLHEVAHGWVAYQCGDDTAYLMGRLTLNPLKHIDPFMTIVLPVACVLMGMPAFGGPKPIPVNPYRLRHPVRDERLVSAAGVAANLLIAFALAVVLRLALATGVFQPNSPGTAVLGLSILSNLVLFMFNLTPIPPLDGSRLLRSFLPWEIRHWFNMLDPWGLFIVFVVIQLREFDVLLFRGLEFMWGMILMLPPELLREMTGHLR